MSFGSLRSGGPHSGPYDYDCMSWCLGALAVRSGKLRAAPGKPRPRPPKAAPRRHLDPLILPASRSNAIVSRMYFLSYVPRLALTPALSYGERVDRFLTGAALIPCRSLALRALLRTLACASGSVSAAHASYNAKRASNNRGFAREISEGAQLGARGP